MFNGSNCDWKSQLPWILTEPLNSRDHNCKKIIFGLFLNNLEFITPRSQASQQSKISIKHILLSINSKKFTPKKKDKSYHSLRFLAEKRWKQILQRTQFYNIIIYKEDHATLLVQPWDLVASLAYAQVWEIYQSIFKVSFNENIPAGFNENCCIPKKQLFIKECKFINLIQFCSFQQFFNMRIYDWKIFKILIWRPI